MTKNQRWRRGLYFLVFLAIVLATSNCAEFSNFQAYLNKEFCLSIGQRASIAGENLEIGFKEVIEDSRCPRSATCVWAGQITCRVELKHANVSNQILLTELGLTDEYSRERYEGYELAFHVTPYPEAGKEIPDDAYCLNLVITKLTEAMTGVIGSIISEPFAFEGQEITIVGYYRGWDLLHEANTAPPVTRSDWVIKDLTGAIYISAHSEAKVPEGLRPSSLQDTGIILEVKGVVLVTKEGQPYVKATSIERIP